MRNTFDNHLKMSRNVSNVHCSIDLGLKVLSCTRQRKTYFCQDMNSLLGFFCYLPIAVEMMQQKKTAEESVVFSRYFLVLK